MTMIAEPATVDASAAPERGGMSPFARLIAIYTRPASAWTGLRERGQWWFPLLVTVLVTSLFTAAIYSRAFVPMMTAQFEQQVENGQIPAEQAERMEEFFSGPGGMAITVGQQLVLLPIVTLCTALAIWFAGGFMLGTRLTYRQSLDVAAWSSLVTLPAFLVAGAIAWARNVSFRDVHLGFAALLPEVDAPTRVHTGLAVLLDALGPFSIWYVVVVVLGTAALSGAPRRSVAYTVGGLYVALVIFFAALAAWFTPSP